MLLLFQTNVHPIPKKKINALMTDFSIDLPNLKLILDGERDGFEAPVKKNLLIGKRNSVFDVVDVLTTQQHRRRHMTTFDLFEAFHDDNREGYKGQSAVP